MSLRVVILACVAAVYSSVTVYNPPEAGNALDALESALNKIVSNTHLPASQLAAAKKVVVDVESTVQFLESAKGKALSKEAHGAKVMAAIKELQDLQDSWQKASEAKVTDRRAKLEKKLQEKQAELAKDMKMMKVLNLEKALAEKKLKLQTLIDSKREGDAKKEDAKEIAAREEMIANVLKMAKEVQSSHGTNATMTHAVKTVAEGKPKLLATVNSYLEGRMKTISASMATIDAAEKKREGEIKATLGGAEGTKANAEELKKSEAILNMLMKKEKRNYMKMRATLQTEYNELEKVCGHSPRSFGKKKYWQEFWQALTCNCNLPGGNSP
jgi:hypothetical protein